MSDFQIAIISVTVGAALGFFPTFIGFKLQVRKEKRNKRLDKLEEVHRLFIKCGFIISKSLYYVNNKLDGVIILGYKGESWEPFYSIMSLLKLYGSKDFKEYNEKFANTFYEFATLWGKMRNKGGGASEVKNTLEDLEDIINKIEMKINKIFEEEYGIKLSKIDKY